MKRVIIHVGPHKTGTTSLQYFLAKKLPQYLDSPIEGAKENMPLLKRLFFKPMPRAFYPREEFCSEGDFGQNRLASYLCADFDEFNPEFGLSLVKKAVSSMPNFSTLVLSAENLCYLSEVEASNLREVLGEAECSLVFTLSPFGRRFTSYYSTMLGFGYSGLLEEFAPVFSRHPGTNPEMFRRIFNGLRPDRTLFLVSSAGSSPESLLRNFWNIIGLAWPDDISSDLVSLKNTSLSEFELDILRCINKKASEVVDFDFFVPRRTPDFDDYVSVRNQLMELMRSQSWQNIILSRRSELPSKVKPFLDRIISLTIAEIEKLCKEKSVGIIGSLDTLYD